MKRIKKILVETICWISLILVFIANIVPVLSITDGSDTAKGYLVSLLSGGSLSLSSIGGVTVIPFYGVLIVALLLICPILLMQQSKVAKRIGFGLSMALFATVIYYMRGINEIVKNLNRYDDLVISKIGIILLLIAYILILLCSIFVIIDDMYGESINKLISTASNGKSLKELLEENEKLYADKLITEEEYKTRRENLINRG